MKKVALLCYGTKNISSLSEAIKIFTIKDAYLDFTIYTDSYSVKNYFNSSKNCVVIYSEKIVDDIDILSNEFDIIINLTKQNYIFNENFKFFAYLRNDNDSSLIIPFSGDQIENLNSRISIISESFNIHKDVYYLENNTYLNQEVIVQLSKNESYKGIFNPANFFKLNNGIYFANEEKIEFIKSFYNALNDKQKEASERKSISSYFSKIVFSFQKDDAYGKSSYNLFNYLFMVKEGKLLINLDPSLSPSELILIFNFIAKL